MALLPVSTAETPSIMMLFPPPPPIRVVPVTPGASEASAVKLRLAMGRFSTESVVTVNERSPLCVLTRAASLDYLDGLGQAADFDGDHADSARGRRR